MIVTDHTPCRRCGSPIWHVFSSGRERCKPCLDLYRREGVIVKPRIGLPRKENHKRWRTENRDHFLAYRRQYYSKTRFRRLAMAHGTTEELLVQRMADQQDACAACREAIDWAASRSFNIDHDHDCCPGPYSCGRCIRGLLCNECNRLAVDIKRVEAVASYLRRWSP